jgi:hypothetical protein
MSESLSEWLALREAADWSARSATLVQRVSEALAQSEPVRGLDLCTGTGSNLRYLMDRLPRRQHWLVVDRDSTLLEEVPGRLSAWAQTKECSVSTDGRVSHVHGPRVDARIETRQMNLGQLDAAIFHGRNIVTASALLDLVSESWLRLLASFCQTAGAITLFSITYNGQSSCDPAEPEDDMVRELMNLHQKTDKGLGGPAAGPEAGAVAERVFKEVGYRVEMASSDWLLGPVEREFQRQLIEGWAHAAREIAPRHASTVEDWLSRRLTHIAAGRSRIVVGHVDMAALPGPADEVDGALRRG